MLGAMVQQVILRQGRKKAKKARDLPRGGIDVRFTMSDGELNINFVVPKTLLGCTFPANILNF